MAMKLKYQLHRWKSIIFSLKPFRNWNNKKKIEKKTCIIIDDITSYFDEDRRKSILEFYKKRDISFNKLNR